MAENASHEEFVPGEMDISSHQQTYSAFMSVSKWSIGGIVVLLVVMAATLL